MPSRETQIEWGWIQEKSCWAFVVTVTEKKPIRTAASMMSLMVLPSSFQRVGSPAFQIDETGTSCVGASQRLHDVIELPLTVAGAAIDGAVLAAEVAFVGYEQDGLERGAASEEAGSDEPPGEGRRIA